MKTTNVNIKIERKTIPLDASNQSVGRLATKIALLLRGKGKVNFSPQIDNGDFVNVTNINNLKFTGKKKEQKTYYRHSQYPGGIKKIPIKKWLKDNPGKILRNAVYKMLPKTRLREAMIKRLTIK
ncbi:MAG: 50S ribosomal protein L13 [Patescibacteria group bacterium]